MRFITVPLEPFHIKDTFTCGKTSLDRYIRLQASQDFKKRLSVCFVVTDETHRVKGYYTLSSSSIQVGNAPVLLKKKLPEAYKNIPVILLGRLAVDVHFKGKGLGELLLFDAIKRCIEASKTIGSIAVIVDPLDQDTISFYEKFGFIVLNNGQMFLHLKTAALLLPKS